MIDATKLPFGGESILLSRMRKLAPELVIVSFLPPRVRFNVAPHAFVRAIPHKDYDWRFLRKLHVMVVCDKEHATVGIFEKLCRVAFPVQAWFHAERKGYDVSYLPTAASVERADSKTWEWNLTFEPFMEFQNREWGDLFEGSMGEFRHVQHHS